MSEHVVGDGYLEIRHPYMTKETMSNYAFVVYSKIQRETERNPKFQVKILTTHKKSEAD